MMATQFVFVTLLIFCSLSSCQLVIHSPSSIANQYFSGPLAMLPLTFNVSARITYIDGELCSGSPSQKTIERLNNTIVMVDETAATCAVQPAVAAKMLIPYGAIGMIMYEVQGVGTIEVEHPNIDHSVYMPAVTISSFSFAAIRDVITKNSDTVTGTITPAGPNLWKELTNGPVGIILQVIGFIVVLFTLGVALYKWRLFIIAFGLELSVTQVCIVFEIIACVIRLIFLIDPIAYYGIITVHVSSDLVSLSSPFSLCGVLLIAVYWGNILDKVGSYSRASRWLQERLKIYLIFAGIIFVVMLALVFYDLALPVQGAAALGVLVIMGIVFVLVALYFFFNGIRVYKAMTSMPATRSKKKNTTAQTITKYVGTLGGSLIGVVISLIILAIVRYSNEQIFGANWNLFLWMFLVSLIVVLTFQPPSAMTSTSNTPQAEDAPTVRSGSETPASAPSPHVTRKEVDDEDEENNNSSSVEIPTVVTVAAVTEEEKV